MTIRFKESLNFLVFHSSFKYPLGLPLDLQTFASIAKSLRYPVQMLHCSFERRYDTNLCRQLGVRADLTMSLMHRTYMYCTEVSLSSLGTLRLTSTG